MKKLIAVFALALATAAFSPRAAAAEGGDCATGYTQCLNDTWHLSGLLQNLADIECFAGYLGCLKLTMSS